MTRERHRCAVDGCDRWVVGNGYCVAHWRRNRLYGDPLASAPKRAHRPDCGHCLAHRGIPKRKRTPAEADAISARRRAAAEPNYHSMHRNRLRRDRGLPADHRCQCGAVAQEWAMREDVPPGFVRWSPLGVAFSVRTEDYDPRCRSCHRREDAQRRRAA